MKDFGDIYGFGFKVVRTCLTLTLEHRTNNIAFANGKITVIAKITADAGFEGWIKISSTATLNANSMKYTRVVYFDPVNPIDMKWKTE